MMEKTYTETQTKKAFWDMFHESGELWFGDSKTDEDHKQEFTNSFWDEFLDKLKETHEIKM